ncbi:MAG: hypothetical protein ACP5O7_02070 [Phycisphaerae bacterium]
MKPTGASMLAIVALCVLCGVGYGIIHDEITARICPQYFNVDHPALGWPAVFHSRSPTVLGLAWGIVATAPLVTFFGVMLALAAQAGRWPQVAPRVLALPLVIGLLFMAACAVAGGLSGHRVRLASAHALSASAVRFKNISNIVGERTDFYAHAASYLAGAVVGLALPIGTIVHRRRAWQRSQQPE